MRMLGIADTIKEIFPPFPIPEFIPNFTGFDLDKKNINWYDLYETAAPDESKTLIYVRTTFSAVHSLVLIVLL